jgi:hypothetical protein
MPHCLDLGPHFRLGVVTECEVVAVSADRAGGIAEEGPDDPTVAARLCAAFTQ